MQTCLSSHLLLPVIHLFNWLMFCLCSSYHCMLLLDIMRTWMCQSWHRKISSVVWWPCAKTLRKSMQMK